MPVVIQITDTHLFTDPHSHMNGVYPSASLQSVIDTIQSTETRVDLILATGDLVHDDDPENYQRLADRLTVLGAPVLYLPGNHDIPQALAKAVTCAPVQNAIEARLHGWRFVLLDTTEPGKVGGHLSDEALESLRLSIETGPTMPTLIALHHHPVPVASRWMDAIKLDNSDDFFDIVGANPQVKGIIFGHVHQEFESHVGRIRVMGTPSTCMQFTPKSEAMACDTRPPAYRRLTLHPNGHIDSQVCFLEPAPP